jgi:hypothetical protein
MLVLVPVVSFLVPVLVMVTGELLRGTALQMAAVAVGEAVVV